MFEDGCLLSDVSAWRTLQTTGEARGAAPGASLPSSEDRDQGSEEVSALIPDI